MNHLCFVFFNKAGSIHLSFLVLAYTFKLCLALMFTFAEQLHYFSYPTIFLTNHIIEQNKVLFYSSQFSQHIFLRELKRAFKKRGEIHLIFNTDIPRWAGAFMGWGQQCRIRHVTSGRYLAATGDGSVVTVHRQKADEASTAFNLLMSKVRQAISHFE